MDSILKSIKKLLGPTGEYEYFDDDITLHINTVLMTLTQLGVGPSSGFSITDDTAKWTDFVPRATLARIEAIKTYVYLNVKLLFDPPSSSTHMEAINRQISMLEWRINAAVDYKQPINVEAEIDKVIDVQNQYIENKGGDE
jgi:hypothetical protein